MSDSTSLRRYTDQEMALILKRAAELQEGIAPTPGRSLEEIEEIAKEAGIDPAFVANAAAELREPPRRRGFFGAPTRFHEERMVRGTLSTTALRELVDRARAETGLHGDVVQVLDSVEWRGRASLGATVVALTPRGGGTRLAVTVSRGDEAVAVVTTSIVAGIATAILGGVAVAGSIGSPLIESLIIAGCGVGGFAASAQLWWRGLANRWRRRTQAIADTLAERAGELMEQGTGPAAE